MAIDSASIWQEQNQQALRTALARVQSAVQRYAARDQAGGAVAAAEPDARTEAAEEPEGMSPPSALGILSDTFALSPFERDLLLLCAGVELDARFLRLCAMAQADPQKEYATFSLALAALAQPHWSALAPDAPLRHWQLVHIGAGSGLTLSPLRIDERILNYLLGVHHFDARLAGLVTIKHSSGEQVPSRQQQVRRLGAAWSRPAAPTLPLLHLYGATAQERQSFAAQVCAPLGLKLAVLQASTLPTAAAELDLLLRLWEREAALSPGALLVECADMDTDDKSRAALVARFVEPGRCAMFLSAQDQWFSIGGAIGCEVTRPTQDEQRRLWHTATGVGRRLSEEQITRLVSQFNLSGRDIAEASLQASVAEVSSGDDSLLHAVWDSCRKQARPRLQDLAQPIETGPKWDDLVLPDLQRQILYDIASHVRQRYKVYEDWGFGRNGARGLGISALFCGSSGTGKTMAAEALANELRLDLYRIDLSSVVSKYIGETEKNLRRVFDAAESGGAVLLFDEADALFGKRSEVKDSHDRYANIEVSYLLQRMECYQGLAILTTNLKSAMDTAFMRRLRFVVQFPFPDDAQRQAIWSRVFPCDTPTENLDMRKLARLNLAGGNIRNIALNAAFLAADANEPVKMTHLLRAARIEYAKLEKPLTDLETAGWV